MKRKRKKPSKNNTCKRGHGDNYKIINFLKTQTHTNPHPKYISEMWPLILQSLVRIATYLRTLRNAN